MDNEIIFDELDCEHLFWSLQWIVQAKCIVRTPNLFYIRRNTPDNQTNSRVSWQGFEKLIAHKFELSHFYNRNLDKINFFHDNEFAKALAIWKILRTREVFDFEWRNQIYKNGITPEIFKATENAFKKYYGENYFYPMFMFNWAHSETYKESPFQITDTE